MDIRMPGLDGLAATRQVTGDGDLAEVKVVMLTTFELDEYVFEALRSGAFGLLSGEGHRTGGTPARGAGGGGGRRTPLTRCDPPADRRVRGPLQGTGRRGGPDRTHRAGTGGDGAGRHGSVQRGDRAASRRQSAHRQDPRQPDHGETGRPRPRPTGRPGLRVRPGTAGLARLIRLI